MPLLCNLEPLIACKINATSSGTTSNDLLATVVAMDQYTQERDNSVADINSLPYLTGTTTCPGSMVFVRSICAPVVSDGGDWFSLDGKRVKRGQLFDFIYGWGNNGQGQLGTNTAGVGTSRSSPVSVVGGFTNWCQVSSSKEGPQALAIRTNGTLWGWGANSYGELGQNVTTLTSRSSPVSVVGGFTDWCQVSAGSFFTSAIRTNCTLWTWGSNNCGQLGDNTTINRSSPVSVVGGFTDWCQVSAGDTSIAAIRTNGTLWTWGSNVFGILGQSTLSTENKLSPVSVVGGFTDWCQVSVGFTHMAAIRTNGTLWTWGCGGCGELGNGTTIINASSPVSVIGGFTDWCQVSAGCTTTAAVRTNGTLWTWGENYGKLGNNQPGPNAQNSPVSVVGGFTDWSQVSVGRLSVAAIRNNGTLWVWGNHAIGGGDNTSLCRSSPVSVVGCFTDWCQVSVGCWFVMAITRTTNL